MTVEKPAEKMVPLKITQVAAAADQIVVVCEDGSLWRRSLWSKDENSWIEVSPPSRPFVDRGEPSPPPSSMSVYY